MAPRTTSLTEGGMRAAKNYNKLFDQLGRDGRSHSTYLSRLRRKFPPLRILACKKIPAILVAVSRHEY